MNEKLFYRFAQNFVYQKCICIYAKDLDYQRDKRRTDVQEHVNIID